MPQNLAVIIVMAASFFGGFIGALLGTVVPSDDNGCVSGEALVRLADRDTCYPETLLPPELAAYLDGKPE